VLIDCDTCTVRGQGCDDCVVTVLLGVPPDWRGSDPTVVPLTRRGTTAAVPRTGSAAALRHEAGRSAEGAHRAESRGDAREVDSATSDVRHVDTVSGSGRSVVELDDVERRAVRALAEFGLVPPLRHQDASTPGDRHVS
jgi:hypothetical protein